ncbi:1-acylglycerol-3-phosphate O-acyltransferase PNPLA3 [Orycteropus afer afer]|uniref:1-acylglycerol-3-phosphate O-acyltransferase PNPLA3 n=1 Tax=Orycteropus afer afer TaxID=1230840 RepID=A0A8B7A198_ORYAF|nr:1-acylglycerol-3-phosphate O-acyltransferase PNPLA3 [Orycteropus afer afer]
MYDPEVGWHLSFAGSGFLGFYYLGVIRCMNERAPHLLRDARKFYCSSSGTLFCATLLAGIPLDRLAQLFVAFNQHARRYNFGSLHLSFNIANFIRDLLHTHLPANIHQLVSGKMCVSLTRVSDGENVQVSDFQSKDEVVDALVCSCFLPFFSGFIPPTFRGVGIGEMCVRGYLDTVRFLEEKVRLTILPWDESILDILSPRLFIVLCETLKDRGGYLSRLCNFFPVWMLSCLLRLCALPVVATIAVVQRLVMWLPDIHEDLKWLQWAVSHVCSRVVRGLLPTSR